MNPATGISQKKNAMNLKVRGGGKRKLDVKKGINVVSIMTSAKIIARLSM